MDVKPVKPKSKLDPRTRLVLGGMGVTAIMMSGRIFPLAMALGLLCASLLFLK